MAYIYIKHFYSPLKNEKFLPYKAVCRHAQYIFRGLYVELVSLETNQLVYKLTSQPVSLQTNQPTN